MLDITTHPTEPFSARLKRMREAAGLTQYALAKASGVSTASLSRIEAGKRSLTVKTLARLATALHASLGDFDGCTHG